MSWNLAVLIFMVVWFAGVLIVWPRHIRASIHSRQERGEPVNPQAPIGATYCERHASGHCRGLFAGATNCLMVAITGDELWITPIFPFNLVAPYGKHGLEYRVQRSQVTSARQLERGWRSYNLLLELPNANGQLRELELRLNNPDRFLIALEGAT